jgi:predicted ATPase/class 3 adenylate cyclase
MQPGHMDERTDVQVRILGPIQVLDENGEAALSPQSRRLLALLAVHQGSEVSADRIAECLSDGDLDGSKLRNAVLRLRKVLGDRVETVAGGYRLRLREDEFDAARFETLRERSRVAPKSERPALIAEALDMWEGHALEDLADEEWAAATATRLDGARAALTEDLAEALNNVGRFDESIEVLETHLLSHPFRERPVALLMRAAAGCGRLPEALRAYQRYRVTLRDEICLDPSSELRALESELLTDGDDGTRDPPTPEPTSLPSGTVTFLFTDIEGSTERWQRDEALMSEDLADHDKAIRAAVEAQRGVVFKHTGDGLCAVFTSAPAAVEASVGIHQTVGLPVRVGVHIGEAEMRNGDYFGPTLNRAARVMDAGHGGQTLVSAPVAALLSGHELVDHGRHRLKGLTAPEQLFQIGHQTFPPLRTVKARVGNLPDGLTSFIGREREIVALIDTLADQRVVTLIGVGGTGKTRLSIETAATMAPTFSDGCWLVELAAITAPEAVPFAFANGLGITLPEQADITDVVVEWLRHRRALVIVDNCEHLLAAAADLVESIAEACPAITVLSTSREPLMLNGEHLMSVPSLAEPDACRLFTERALAERPDLLLDTEQTNAIGELCQRLDGLPLALELAASRVRAFTPVELVASLEERFRMLVGGRRSRMERHQTMRGTLDWSYDLCAGAEQTVFDRLSVFPAGFDMDGARAVAGGHGVSDFDVGDVVSQLVDRSLLQRATAPDGTSRYRMLETMRAYGREHLQHQEIADRTRSTHAHYMAATIGPLTSRSLGPDELQVWQRLSDYLPDSLVALDWSIDNEEWENAMRVIPTLGALTERAENEMVTRLHGAARAGGAPIHLLDELESRDVDFAILETRGHATERGWRRIRAGLPIPSDRLLFPTYVDFNDGGLSTSDVDEFIGSLERWSGAAPVSRFVAGWWAVRALAHSGHLEALDEPIRRLAELTPGLHSDRATRLLHDLYGTVARLRHDWAEAAHWYRKVVQAGDGSLRTWFDLVAAWHLLTARCLSAEHVEITGAELREPWRCCREQHIDVLQHLGVVATALALHRLGHDDLADRFIAWEHSNDALGVMSRTGFGDLLEIVGLPIATIEPTDNLDTLVAELFTVADSLDKNST